MIADTLFFCLTLAGGWLCLLVSFELSSDASQILVMLGRWLKLAMFP